ncbi:MAG TPA: hypothetical protein DCX45_03645 [Acinetobacter junii]|nr:hypothetical protein [Acinetobacter junii]
MNEPKTIYAGDKVEWTESNSDYLASAGWTYKARIINSAGKFDIDSVANGDDHDVTLTPAITATYTAGKYMMQPYYQHTDGTKQYQPRFEIEVFPDLVAATTYDYRSHARTVLEALEAAIESRATKAQMSISISTPQGSRALQYLTLEELIKAKEYYQGLVNYEEEKNLIDAGQSPGGRVLIQFE